MTALGEVGTRSEVTPNVGIKMLFVVTPDSVVGGTDTFTVDLTKYGCRNIHLIRGWDETTTGSVVATNTCTTAVVAGTLTITPVTANTCVHSYLIWAY